MCETTPDALRVETLPNALLHLVIDRLPAETVLMNVALTSKALHSVTESEDVWLPRLPAALVAALKAATGASSSCSSSSSSAALGSGPPQKPHLSLLYCSLYNANLLRNPWFCLEEQMAERRSGGLDVPGRGKTPWLAPAGGHRWLWEGAAPEGLTIEPGAQPPMPPAPPPPFSRQGGPSWRPAGVVASTHGNVSTLVQEVDLVGELQQRGLSRQAAFYFLDSCPPLQFQVYVAGRFDAPGAYEARVVLDASFGPLPTGNEALNRWMDRSSAVLSTQQQPAEPMVWRQQTLTITEYAPGVRRAVVVLRGTSQQFWRGHYGAKFSSPSLRFVKPYPA